MNRLLTARAVTAVAVLTLMILAGVPALANSYSYTGSYKVSGSLDGQYFGGTIGLTGNKITSYNLSFGGESFTCSSKVGLCGAFLKSFKFSGSNALLAGLFSPDGSPFSLTLSGKGWHQTYWTDMVWSPVSASEESVLLQVGCVLALFLFVIPRARLLQRKA